MLLLYGLKLFFPEKLDINFVSSEYAAADYMNILGDPFSYFVYKTKYGKYTTYKGHIIKEDDQFVVMQFNKSDISPLADSATAIISLDYIKKKYLTKFSTIGFTCNAYDIVINDTQICGVIKGDNIKHNCNSSFLTYLFKLKFRIINNLFHKTESGFSLKEIKNPKLKRRKFLFCFYALFFPLPILDSIRLAIQYQNISFLLHFIYTIHAYKSSYYFWSK